MQIAFSTFMVLCCASNLWGFYEAFKYSEGTGSKVLHFLGAIGGAYAATQPIPFLS